MHRRWRGLHRGGNVCRSKRMKRNCLEDVGQGRDGLSWRRYYVCQGSEMENSLSCRNDEKFLVVGPVRL